jgi:hypothetical protein
VSKDLGLVEHRPPLGSKSKSKKIRKQKKSSGLADSPIPDKTSLSSLSSSLVSQEDGLLENDATDGMSPSLQNLRLEFQDNETDESQGVLKNTI